MTETNLLVVKAGWIITVNQHFEVLEDHCIVIEDDRIVDLLANTSLNEQENYRHAEVMELPGHVLMPGLINSHAHASMSLFRGIANDLPLMDWLNNHIWPAESQYVNRQFIQDGVKLAISEMIRGGTTCFNDMYFFPDEMAQVCQSMGMRAVSGLIVLDFPTPWASSTDEYFSKALAALDEIRQLPLVSCTLAPHAPYTVSDAPLEKIVTLSNELDLPVHMHIHETAFEVDEALKNHGERPLARLDRLGLLNPNLIAVHMTQLNEMEIQRLAETGVHVAHCPESNLKLASGFAPVEQLLQHGVNVCIGTDGAASNNDLDMFSEMRSASLLAKAVAQDASACDAQSSISMATINAAKALGLDEIIGSLEIGKKADLIAIDLSHINSQPIYDPVATLVYSVNSLQVSHLWIDGQLKLKDYLFTDIDVASVLQSAQQWQQKISSAE